MLNFMTCNVNFSAKGWTGSLSCGNIKFVRFGLIFSGTLPDSSNACGYHGCVEHAGRTRIPVASSRQIFLMTFVSRLNGRNIYVKCRLQFVKKNINCKSFWFWFRGDIFAVCLLIWPANKSTSGVPKVSHTALYILGFNCHSVASWNFLEFLSASKLSLPGIKIIFAWNVCCNYV